MSKREIADLLIDVSELSGGRIHRRPRSGESEEREEIEDDDYDFRPPYDLFDSVCDCSDDSDFRPPYDLFHSDSSHEEESHDSSHEEESHDDSHEEESHDEESTGPVTKNNVIVPYDSLAKAIEDHFCCRYCVGKGEANLVKPKIKKATWGICTTVTIECTTCSKTIKIEHDRVDSERKQGQPQISSYLLNHYAILMSHVIGKGQPGLQQIIGGLGLCGTTSNKRGWSRTEQMVGRAEVACADVAMTNNIIAESKATIADGHDAGSDSGVPIDVASSARVPIDVSMDGAWQKKGSGRKYNSLSGHNIAIGARLKGILSYVVYSKICWVHASAEKKGEEAREHDCPRNYEGSSKGMEAKGAVQLTENIFASGFAWVRSLITDDDSSTRANVAHSFEDLAETVTDFVWPRGGRTIKKLKAEESCRLKCQLRNVSSVTQPIEFACTDQTSIA